MERAQPASYLNSEDEMIELNGVSYLSMVEAAKVLGVSTSTIYAMYRHPVIGPPRTQIGKYYYISEVVLEAYELKSRCFECRTTVPFGNKYCSDTCREKYEKARRERLIGASRSPWARYEVGPKQRYDAVCPVCNKKHVIFRDVEPACKWVYCDEHEYRRYCHDPENRRRSEV